MDGPPQPWGLRKKEALPPSWYAYVDHGMFHRVKHFSDVLTVRFFGAVSRHDRLKSQALVVSRRTNNYRCVQAEYRLSDLLGFHTGRKDLFNA